MMDGMYNLVVYPDERLTTVCKPCVESDLETIKQAHRPMMHIMKHYGGIGLAANQIGLDKRFLLLATRTTAPHSIQFEDTVMLINPIITEFSEETKLEAEGCLSLPLLLEPVERSVQITIAFKDENWKDITAVFYGLEARCVQHEIEHLDGKLLLDRLSPMKQQMYFKKLQKNRKCGKVKV